MENKKFDGRDLILKDDLVAIANNSRRKSCSSDRIKVSGEYYKNKKNNQKLTALAQKVAATAAAVLIIGTGIGVVSAASKDDGMTSIRSEATKIVNTYNPIGGTYSEEYLYGDDFAQYINDLDDKELSLLYTEASQEMKEAGLDKESHNQTDVIKHMQEDFKENNTVNVK